MGKIIKLIIALILISILGFCMGFMLIILSELKDLIDTFLLI
jgi:hypothetical protein